MVKHSKLQRGLKIDWEILRLRIISHHDNAHPKPLQAELPCGEHEVS